MGARASSPVDGVPGASPSMPSMRRMSVRASRLVRSMASSAVRARSGRRSSAVNPAPAWITITLT